MDVALLMKSVPRLESLRYDAERRTMIREGSEMFLNPFDQRALRVALDLRRPGERLTVVSMGPPSTESLLREPLALGADRAILVSDPALSGSDTLVTARVLVRALASVGHDLVMTGAWTTDSETGQVGPEVAGLLGVPVASAARAIARVGDDGLAVRCDTEAGWSDLLIRAPAVVTVGEKAGKARKPTAAEIAAASGRAVEIVSAAGLGFPAGSVGLAASPTVVLSLHNEEPSRRPRVFGDGPVEERVVAAVETVRHLLSPARAPTLPLPEVVGPVRDEEEAWVLVTGPDGHLEPDTLPLVSEVRRRLGPLWPSALWLGRPPTGDDRRALARAGALRIARVALPDGPVGSRTAALAVGEFVARRPRCAAGVFVASMFGRAVAGQLAARLGLGLTGDATGMVHAPDGGVVWEKPAFGGGVVAGIRSRTRPSLVTVRAGGFAPALAAPRDDDPAIELEEVPFEPPQELVSVIASARELDERFGDLASAPLVFCVGTGIGGPGALPEICRVARTLGGAVGATRRVTDQGWLPHQLQVGLTGRSLGPSVAVLLGVSGSNNHLVGWRRARVIVAVNADPAAPVFAKADVGIVGRWEEVLPHLAGALAPVARALTAASEEGRASAPPR